MEEAPIKIWMTALKRLSSEGRYSVDFTWHFALVTRPCFVGQAVGFVLDRMRRIERGLPAADWLTGLTLP